MALITRTHDTLTWIDALSPTKEEVRSLIEQYQIPAGVGDELLISTRRSRSDVYTTCAYIVLHFPKQGRHTVGKRLREIDFIIMPNVVITARYAEDPIIEKIGDAFENTPSELPREVSDVGSLIHTILEKLYQSFEIDLERIGKSLEGIEEKIFSGQEKLVVHSLSLLGRELADFKKTLGYHEQALEEILGSGQPLFGETFKRHIGGSIGDYRRIRHQLIGEESFFEELRETNNSLLAIKQNEVIKTLTIMAFITFPLTLIAGIFGMNTRSTPFVGNPHDFWIVIILMVVLTFSMYSFFRHKRWL